MEFAAFLTERSAEHMRFRYDIVRAADPDHLIVAHAMNTASARVPVDHEQDLSRGNDWDYTDFLDGFGASLFPLWFRENVTDFGARVESARSAAQDRLYWVGELQGASARSGIDAQESVPGDLQQRWLWNVIGRGARAVNFWCWRDEVFSKESGGFGLAGNDGEASSRLAALRAAGQFVEANAELLDAYRPAQAEIGVIFEPDGYRMDWANYGACSRQAARSLWGYLVGLEKLQVAYDVVESRHHSHLDRYRLLILPWPLIVNPELAGTLLDWTARGGTLLVESEADSYDARGFYRYPQDRPFARALGIVSRGRRPNNGTDLAISLGDFTGRLRTAGWVEPLDPAGGKSLADSELGPLAVYRRHGQGHVIAIGTLAGLAEDAAVSAGVGSVHTSARAITGWLAARVVPGPRVLPGLADDPLAPSDFTGFLGSVASLAGLSRRLRCSPADGAVVQWRNGRSGQSTLLFVINHGPAQVLTFSGAALDAAGDGVVEDLTAGSKLPVRTSGLKLPAFELPIGAGGYAVVRWLCSAADISA
jgi:beta-galactosidase